MLQPQDQPSHHLPLQYSWEKNSQKHGTTLSASTKRASSSWVTMSSTPECFLLGLGLRRPDRERPQPIFCGNLHNITILQEGRVDAAANHIFESSSTCVLYVLFSAINHTWPIHPQLMGPAFVDDFIIQPPWKLRFRNSRPLLLLTKGKSVGIRDLALWHPFLATL